MRLAMLTKGRLAKPLMDGFASNGCEVHALDGFSKHFEGFDHLLMYGPMAPIGSLIDHLKTVKNLPGIIFWYTEQMPDPRLPAGWIQIFARSRFHSRRWYDEYLVSINRQRLASRIPLPEAGRLRGLGEIIELNRLGFLKIVCAFSRTNCKVLSRTGLPVVQIPIGAHAYFGEQLGLERDIDVVFLGTTRDARRKKWIPRLERELGRTGARFVIKDGSASRGHIFDLERTLLLNRSKIMLNVMRQPWDDALHRFLLAAANGVMLLSEPLWPGSRGPLEPGVHFAESPLFEMAAAVRHYLDASLSRMAINLKAGELIRSELTMSRMANLCLQEIAADKVSVNQTMLS